MTLRLALLAAFPLLGLSAPVATTRLSELDLAGFQQGWQHPRVDQGVSGEPLSVGGEPFDAGIGTHAPSSWTLTLDGKALEFRAAAGVNDGSPGEVEFIVRGDGRDLYRSGPVRGGEPARAIRVPLAGVQRLELIVDPRGPDTSDHADWLDPVILHTGAPLPAARPAPPDEPLLPDAPGEPPNAAAKVDWDASTGRLRLSYDGRVLLEGSAPGATLTTATTRRKQAVTQTLTLSGTNLLLHAVIQAGPEALAAETRGDAQRKFPLVRTTNGPASRNLRNNAVYGRGRDWMIEAAAARTRIDPAANARFQLSGEGDVIVLTLRPRYYQRHKNITHFRPWTYRVRRDSITGWSSWWAYMRNFRQSDLADLLAVWKEKRFADYGYRFIQIDDCFQGGEHAKHTLLPNNGYPGGHPATWLEWRKDLFPGGMAGFAAACVEAGFQPGIWIGSHFGTKDILDAHPDWFVRGVDGKPFLGPWIGAAVDTTNPGAVETLVRPTFRGIHDAGIPYVKIDILRHYLYDNLHHNLDYCRARGTTPADMLRGYLSTARSELGPDTFILSCWGVLPESVGLADACRIGGDGYGPVTMQQYNSWNGIVWRNDPDHCDVFPRFKPAEAGNVSKTATVAAAPADTVIRPALASIAGCLLMLSDRPAVYRDDANLNGLRRSAPVLFSVPGQLYDFDPAKTRNLARMARTDITSGANPSPVDADQFGPVCPWWLNEFDRPFEHWNVLHRLNWSDKPSDTTTVSFADLGLDPSKSWLVYEFWSRTFVGRRTGNMELPALPPMGLASYSIREELDRPQLVSTSRHLSQGAAELDSVEWKDNILSGRSRVVAGDGYELVVRVPEPYHFLSATADGQPATASAKDGLLHLTLPCPATRPVDWRLNFKS